MQGSIAQIIALTNWGNSFLRKGLDIKKHNFYPGNSTFSHCHDVVFTNNFKDNSVNRGTAEGFQDQNIGNKLYARDPIEWLQKLKDSQTRRLRLNYLPSQNSEISDRASVGLVGGGGRWFIEAVKVLTSDFWESQWQADEQGAVDNKKWSVTYDLVSANEPSKTLEFKTSLEEINSHIKKQLGEIAAFAHRNNLDTFAEKFEAGEKIIESNEPLADAYHADILFPGHFSLKAQRCLGAVQAAWVFGAMGSWNDVMLEDSKEHDEYERLSDELYNLFCKGIVYSVNSGLLPD